MVNKFSEVERISKSGEIVVEVAKSELGLGSSEALISCSNCLIFGLSEPSPSVKNFIKLLGSVGPGPSPVLIGSKETIFSFSKVDGLKGSVCGIDEKVVVVVDAVVVVDLSGADFSDSKLMLFSSLFPMKNCMKLLPTGLPSALFNMVAASLENRLGFEGGDLTGGGGGVVVVVVVVVVVLVVVVVGSVVVVVEKEKTISGWFSSGICWLIEPLVGANLNGTGLLRLES